jgi:hypothetical protein
VSRRLASALPSRAEIQSLVGNSVDPMWLLFAMAAKAEAAMQMGVSVGASVAIQMSLSLARQIFIVA